ncbi:MAG: hypothetical protein ACOWWR_15860 [Eubacteriales bacterium]
MQSKLKIIGILCVCFLIVSFSACSKIGDKIEEKVTEGVIEKATGADVDITEDGVNVKTEDGAIEVGNSMDWPSDVMGNLTELNATIDSVIKANNSCSVTFSELSEEEAEVYYNDLVAKEYMDSYQMQDSDSYMYTGTDDEGAIIYFTYNISTQEGNLSIDRGSISEESDN